MNPNKASLLATTAAFVTLGVTKAMACQICVPYPQTTLADVLIESESVILVREYDERPYVFKPVEVLKGSVDGPDIDAFLDSSSRRRLQKNPDDFAVLVRDSAVGRWSYRS